MRIKTPVYNALVDVPESDTQFPSFGAIQEIIGVEIENQAPCNFQPVMYWQLPEAASWAKREKPNTRTSVEVSSWSHLYW